MLRWDDVLAEQLRVQLQHRLCRQLVTLRRCPPAKLPASALQRHTQEVGERSIVVRELDLCRLLCEAKALGSRELPASHRLLHEGRSSTVDRPSLRRGRK